MEGRSTSRSLIFLALNRQELRLALVSGRQHFRQHGLYFYSLPRPSYYIFATPSTICPGGSSSLYTSNSSAGAFQWSTGETTPSISVSPSANTTYTVTVTGSNGCTTVKDVTVTLDSDALTVDPEYYICGRSTPTICPPEANTTTDWYLNTGSQSILVHTGSCFNPTQEGTYYVVQNNPCSAIKAFYVNDLAGQLIPNFNLTTTDRGGYYNITANAAQFSYPTNVPNIGHYWSVEDLTTGCTFNNPSQWWGGAYPTTANSFTNNFPEYGASNCQPSTAYNQGQFEYGHTYRIIRGLWSDCDGWTAYSATINIVLPPEEEGEEGAFFERITYSKEIGTHPKDLQTAGQPANSLPPTHSSKVTLLKPVAFNLYPNPTSGAFTVEFLEEVDATIEVVDLVGRVVLSKTVQENISTVDISDKPSGVYFVKIIRGELTTTRQIIKK